MIREGLAAQKSLVQRRSDHRGITKEVVVVLVCGLVGSIGFAYVALEMMNQVDDPLPYTNYTLLGEVLGPVFFVLSVWVLYSLTSHFLARFFGGRGPVSRMFRVAAWAIVPLGVWLLLRSIVIIALFFTVDIPAVPEGVSPQMQVQNVLELGLEGPIYFATVLLGIGFVVWSWHLLAVGISAAKEISEENARHLAAIPAAIVVLYLVRTAFSWWTPF